MKDVIRSVPPSLPAEHAQFLLTHLRKAFELDAVQQPVYARKEIAWIESHLGQQLLPEANPEQKLQGLYLLARVYAQIGDVQGLKYLQESKDELDPMSQKAEIVNSIAWIGRYYHYQAQHKLAIQSFKSALEMAKPLKHAGVLSTLCAFLSGSYQHILETDQSNDWARECIKVGEDFDNPVPIAVGNEFLAENAFFVGNWMDAISFAERDREIGDKVGAQDRIAWAGYCYTSALFGQGRLNEANYSTETCLELAEQIGEHRLAILVRTLLSMVQADLELDEVSETNAQLAVTQADEIDQVFIQCLSRSAYAYQLIKQLELKKSDDGLPGREIYLRIQ